MPICDDGPFIEHQYRRAIEAVAEALLDWQMLGGEEGLSRPLLIFSERRLG